MSIISREYLLAVSYPSTLSVLNRAQLVIPKHFDAGVKCFVVLPDVGVYGNTHRPCRAPSSSARSESLIVALCTLCVLRVNDKRLKFNGKDGDGFLSTSNIHICSNSRAVFWTGR